jgi:hypothetical protein
MALQRTKETHRTGGKRGEDSEMDATAGWLELTTGKQAWTTVP